jgi:MTH538 TIR-like domain (DUF1863)
MPTTIRRNVFYSFHYKPDNWRVQQVRQMGALAGNPSVSVNTWETIVARGDKAIRAWIDKNMHGKSCAVILIGARTAGRKWIDYEIEKAWNDGKGVVGVRIHRLRNRRGEQAAQGANPFADFSVGSKSLADIVKVHTPPTTNSHKAYAHIEKNLATWVEEAIRIRNRY